jgi:hypothetical protein
MGNSLNWKELRKASSSPPVASRKPLPASEASHYLQLLGTAVRLAADSIRVHKLRSFLTLLGIIIGSRAW